MDALVHLHGLSLKNTHPEKLSDLLRYSGGSEPARRASAGLVVMHDASRWFWHSLSFPH